eukprot:3988646-Prymnesium_polylepis.1
MSTQWKEGKALSGFTAPVRLTDRDLCAFTSQRRRSDGASGRHGAARAGGDVYHSFGGGHHPS